MHGIARLEHIDTGRMVTLRARHLVGRAPDADLRFDAPRISARHAELYYLPDGWFIRDLGSRNGTWVDGAPVAPGGDVTLRVGSRIEFAGPGCAWRLASSAAPYAAAVPLDGGAPVEEEDGVIALPGGEAPVSVVIHDAPEGWQCRRGDDDRVARDGEVVEAGGRLWRLSLPSAVISTLVSLEGPRPDVVLRFVVSRDEEHVELTVLWGDQSFTPRARAHAYTLLTLARHRLADEREGVIPPAEQGWIHKDELCRRLRVEANLLHTHLFRARRQLADAGVPGTDGLFERRLDAGQLRIGVATIEVVTG
ncbi:MAG: FHA domain-containing protein [Pseudomonadota bacterium]|nr:FHA domain-containing protein [Pseudomonadota bacterium]